MIDDKLLYEGGLYMTTPGTKVAMRALLEVLIRSYPGLSWNLVHVLSHTPPPVEGMLLLLEPVKNRLYTNSFPCSEQTERAKPYQEVVYLLESYNNN